ncbi:MAG: metallophosphoesterase [Patescibacteria group bacterium]
MKPAFVVLVGLPGSRKSTFINDNPSIKDFVISSNEIRMKFGGIVLQEEQTESIEQLHDKLVWSTIDTMIETRLKNGLTTILNATNCNVEKLRTKYYPLTQKYNFRFVIIHFHVSLELALKRNNEPNCVRKASESRILKMNEHLANFGTPHWADLILNANTINDFWLAIKEPNPDWSKYNSIYVIGDIQGCNDQLKLFLDDANYQNSMFVFLGDLTDRGPKNLETVRTINQLKKNLKKRVVLVKGNHDIYSAEYFNDDEPSSQNFAATKLEYDQANISQKEINELMKFYQKFNWYQLANVFDHTFYFTHGGVDRVIDNFSTITGRQFVRGVYDRESCYKCDAAFSEDSLKNYNGKYWSLHGHRNPERNHFLTTPRTFVLESQVEFDGFLSVLEIIPDKSNNPYPFHFVNHKYRLK